MRYWQEGSDEEWSVAEILLEKGKYRQALFFGHLALEKILKALVVRATEEIPPRIHNLRTLAEMTGCKVPNDVMIELRNVEAHQIRGRYPTEGTRLPSPKMAREDLERMERLRQWFKKQF
ncbi:HEPN domain-containing protein [bacterium]|nr:HEPN domain-containing protein [bacterium]